jgi:hypothetical protein
MIGVQAVIVAAILLLPLSASAGPLKRWEAPVVQLPYATYQGFHNETSGLDVFLGVRYAASTEGQNRWRLAQPPEDQTDQGALNATAFPPQCPQAVAGVSVSVRQLWFRTPLTPSGYHPCIDLQPHPGGRLGGLPLCERVQESFRGEAAGARLDPRRGMGS